MHNEPKHLMPDYNITAFNELVTATRGAYRALEAEGDVDAIYANLKNIYAEHGLDANVAESSVDWFEGGTLREDLTDALKRQPGTVVVLAYDPAEDDLGPEPCDCGDFEGCSSCHAWAVEQLESGLDPYDLNRPIESDEVIDLPPKWY